MGTTYEPPMMTYEEWLEKLGGMKSAPAFAEAYRLYVARFKGGNPS